MPVHSAGVILWRRYVADVPVLEVLLGHMGGPMWQRRDERAWSIPKGEFDPDRESAREAAAREFGEELGLPVPEGEWLDLGSVRQNGGKVVRAFAVAAELDPADVVPGTTSITWPPRSGRRMVIPELDRVAWWPLEQARTRIIGAQAHLLDRLAAAVDGPGLDRP